MDISEMHNVFRVLSQQMGLHLVRAILPESIDIFINAEIQDLVNRELMQNSIVETQNNSNYNSISVSSINTFKTLHYKIKFQLLNTSSWDTNFIENDVDAKFNPLFILKVALENDEGVTIPCRIINPDLVEETINDYCSAPDKNNPIVTFYNELNGSNKSYKSVIYCNDSSAEFVIMKIDYIKQPAKVDINSKINCDLPEHLHYDIVKNAVKRFYDAIGSSVSNKQNITNK